MVDRARRLTVALNGLVVAPCDALYLARAGRDPTRSSAFGTAPIGVVPMAVGASRDGKNSG